MKSVVNKPLAPSAKKYKPIWFVSVFATLGLLLASCSSTALPPGQDSKDISELATVNIQGNDSKEALEDKYGATVVVFRPEAGFAVLGFDENQSRLTMLSTEADIELEISDLDEADANGTGVWGGGTGAWGGGTGAWGGGTGAWGGGTGAWGGGTGAWGGGSAVPGTPAEGYAIWEQIQLPQGHGLLTTDFGENVKVAVIDTGLDIAHPMFKNNLVPASEWYDFVSRDALPSEGVGAFYGHGTAVTGVLLQVAPEAKILPLRVLDGKGKGKLSNIASAIDRAIMQGADVINMSLGTTSNSSILKTMLEYAQSQGVYVIASSGNEGKKKILSPSSFALGSNYIISVGSIASNSCRSSFSNYDSSLDVAAPGERVYTAFPDNQIGYATGTSFSAPMVSGMIALAYSNASSLEQSQLKGLLESAATAFTPNNCTGSIDGKVTVEGLLKKVVQ